MANTSVQVDVDLRVTEPSTAIHGWLEPKLIEVAHLAGVGSGTINITIVDDEEMTRLHRLYRGEPGTTDVLTFDLSTPPNPTGPDPAAHIETDLVMCLDEAARQAKRRGHDTRAEVLLYAVHGMLHLLGYDDHNPPDARAMHLREDELLSAVGVGPLYQAKPRAADEGPRRTRQSS